MTGSPGHDGPDKKTSDNHKPAAVSVRDVAPDGTERRVNPFEGAEQQTPVLLQTNPRNIAHY